MNAILLTSRLLSNGELVYPKRGNPPPIPEGYRRKSNNLSSPDAWIMVPIWKDCCFRKRVSQQRQDCTCVTFVYFCEHTDNKHKQVTAMICENCKLK